MPNVKTDYDQDGRGPERYPPAKAHHLGWGQHFFQDIEQTIADKETDWCSDFRESSIKCPFVSRRVFRSNQNGTGPFAAQADSLNKAAKAKQQRAANPDALIAGNKADRHRGNPHYQKRYDQRLFTTQPITKMTKDK